MKITIGKTLDLSKAMWDRLISVPKDSNYNEYTKNDKDIREIQELEAIGLVKTSWYSQSEYELTEFGELFVKKLTRKL